MNAQAGEDVRSYTSLMSKIHLHALTESSLHKYLTVLQPLLLHNKSQHILLTPLFWKKTDITGDEPMKSRQQHCRSGPRVIGSDTVRW